MNRRAVNRVLTAGQDEGIHVGSEMVARPFCYPGSNPEAVTFSFYDPPRHPGPGEPVGLIRSCVRTNL